MFVATTNAQLVSVPFDDGFIGNIGSNSQDARSILKFSTLGISKSAFIQQTNNGQFYETQGNDIGGKLRLYFTAPKNVTINGSTITKSYIDVDGAIVWRGPGGGVGDYYGFLPNPNTNITFNYGVSSSFTITRSSNGSTGSNIGNLRVDKTASFSDNTNEGGNAAGVLSDLNSYRISVQSLDPSGPVSVNSQTTTNQTPTITGTATINAGETLTVTVNGVVYTENDGNLTRSGISWTLVIPNANILPVATYSIEAIITNSNGYTLTDLTSNELTIIQPSLTVFGTLKTFTTCSGCTVEPQTFTVSGTNLSTNNITVTAPTGVQVSTNLNNGFSTSINIAPSSGTVTTTTVYAKLTNNATSVASGVISVTSTGATSRAISVTTNADNALHFDGVNDYVSIADNNKLDFTNAFTIEGWVNPSSTSGGVILGKIDDVSSGNGADIAYALRFGNTGFRAEISDGNFPSYFVAVNNYTLNKWQHIAMVYNAGILSLYINGVYQNQVNTGYGNNALKNSASSLKFGVYSTNFGQYFNGALDNFRFWNVARTQAQISSSMKEEIIGTQTGLVASYTFNHGIGNSNNASVTTLEDQTNNNLNGTLISNTFALNGSTSNFISGYVPPITAANNATSVPSGNTLQLSNTLTGGAWASSNINLATIDATTGLVTGVANGTVSFTYTICDKVVSYSLNVTQPTIAASGTLKTFTTCSGCVIPAQSFTVSGSNLGTPITVTAPTGFVVSNSLNGTFSTTLSLAISAGSLTSTSVYVKLINNATTATSGNIIITSTGAISQTITANVNTENALDFDGIDDHVILDNIGNNANFTVSPSGSITIEAWINRRSSSDSEVILSKYNIGIGGNYYFMVENTGKINFRIYDLNAVNSNAIIPVNEWHHVAAVYNGSSVSIYIDGVLDNSVSRTGAQNQNVSAIKVLIGARYSSNVVGDYFKGKIDEVRIWNVARTQTQISSQMNEEIIGSQTGLLASYTFNHGNASNNNTTITTLVDQTNNTLDGILQNFTLSGTTSNFVSGFVPSITAAGNATTVPSGNTLQLSNGLSGGVWSTTNSSIATIDASTGLVTGVAVGTVSFTYTICEKVVSYSLNVTQPTITVSGSLKTFTSCSGCTIPTQSFTVSGSNLGSSLIITPPTGVEVSTLSNTSFASSLTITPTAGSVSNTTIYVRLTNTASSIADGMIAVASTGATSQSISVTTNTDNALDFNGSNTIDLSLSNLFDVSTNFTIETWVKLPSTPKASINTIVAKTSAGLSDNGFMFGINDWNTSNLKPTFEYTGGAVSASSSITAGVWNHVAVVLNGTTLTFYINGQSAGTYTGVSITPNTVEKMFIGSFSGLYYTFKGQMDNLRFWNSVKNQSEIQDLMFKEVLGSETGLLASYDFNQGIINGTNTSISNLLDQTSNALNGSITAFSRTGNTSNFVAGFIPPIKSVSNATSIIVGSTLQLTNGLTGGTWSSSNLSLASVNTSGLITGVAAGSLSITYSICNKTTSFNLTINPPAPAGLTYNTPNVYNTGTTISALNPTSTGGAITQYSIGPSLPAGLTINPTTGIISGTPSAGSSQTTYTVTGTNASGTVTATVVITVNEAAPASLSYTTPNVYTAGTTITALNPTSTGGPITQYTIGPSLPAGLTINPTTGVISGTPSVTSSQTTYTVTGTNASGTITATVVITVNASAGAPLVQTQTDYCEQAQVSEYKYAKVVFSNTKTLSAANSIQVAEWKWFNGNSEISRTNVTVTNPNGSNPGGETPSNIYDGSNSTKWLDFNIKTGNNTSTLLFTFPGTGARITGYSWVTANDSEERDPKSWIVYMSNDNVNWTQVDAVSNYVAPSARNTATIAWSYTSGSSPVTLTATAATGYTLRWYTTATGGTATTTAPTLNTSNAGTTSHYVSQINQSGYETARATLTVTVNALPVAPVVITPISYTTGTAANVLSATALSGHTLQWYTVASGGTATSTAITPATSTVGTQNYYVSQVNSTTGCESARSSIAVTVSNAVVAQPQASLNAVDYGLLATDTVKLKLTTSNGVAPFTLILNNSLNTVKDTINNLTPVNNAVEFSLKRMDTTKVFTIYKLIDANNNTRTSGFTKDTTIVNLLKPKILLTLKADPAVKQPDNSFKTRLLLKVKNSGDIDLRNVQVNANLSTVFPSGINYKLDSVRVLSGNFALNPSYTGSGTATSASSSDWLVTATANGSRKSFATLDENYLFNNGVSLTQGQEGSVAYYVSIGATTQNVTLKLQFESAGDGVVVKNDGSSSAQGTTSKSDDGTNINQHPDLTNQGLPLPTYVPLIPNEKIGASLNVSSATPVTGGYKYHFTAKIKNYGNVNLDSLRIQYNFNELYPAPDQASIIGTPTITRGNIVYNANLYDGYNDVYLFKYGGDLQVGDSATYEYDLKVTTARTAYTWPNYFVAYGRSINSGLFVNDTSMAGTNPDPNNDSDPIEKFYTKVTINFTPPAPPTVENKTYLYGSTKPANIGGLVKTTPTGTIPVWCDLKTAACSITPPATPTEIGKYIFALRSYDTTTLLYSEVLVYDTVIIKPPVPIVVNKKYIIGNTSNPVNVSNQVTGMTGSTLNYFKNAGLQASIPTLGILSGVTRYTTSQTVNGIESDTVGFTVTMLDPILMLHLRKIADEPKLQTNSTFNITYTFIVTNRTDEAMTNVLVADNLQNTFPSPTLFDVVSVSSTGGLVYNSAFNGKTDIQLLKATSNLAAAAIDTIRLTVNLQPKGYSGTVNNVAVITATTPYGNLNINSSSTGFANETAKLPTPAVIPDLSIDIPEAFSPNRDGVNDRFVILKPYGTTLELEVYNRWGNVVYYNANYNNEWDGRGTNNFIGQDLMDGGYYYTLKVKSVNGNSQIFKGFVLIQR